MQNNRSNPKNLLSESRLVKVIGTQRIVVLTSVIILYAVFCIMSPSFRKYATFISILDASYYIALMAIGETFCLISGGVDLSVGTGMICYALVGGFLIVRQGSMVGVGMLVCVLMGIGFGIFNGLLVAVMDLPPFIATLCTMMITRGLGSIMSHVLAIAWPANGSPDAWFRKIWNVDIGNVRIPVGLGVIILLVIIMSVILRKTKTGRYIIAIGSNKEGAKLSGINVVLYQTMAYVISGLFTGFAGLAYAGTLSSSVTPGGGAGLELTAIAAAVIGGTSISGGSASISGTLLGVFFMVILQIGLPNIGLQANIQQIITGIILIIAVFADVAKNKKIASVMN